MNRDRGSWQHEGLGRPRPNNERDLLPDLIEGTDYLSGLLTDQGLNGKQFAQALAAQGIQVLVPTTMELARHGAHTSWACSPLPLPPSPLTPSA
jgi:hypothetical protein